jgi:hypothetical protein
MKFRTHLIAGACLAACSSGAFAQACPTTISSPADGAAAEIIVKNCKPAATLFIGGASTMSSNVLTIANSQIFDTTAFTPIEIVPGNVPASAATAGLVAANFRAYVGKAKALGSLSGKLVYVVYNFNNGSAGGVSQLLGKTPKLSEQADAAKKIAEATVTFIGPAKDQTTPDTKTANAFCGTTASGVTSTATKVGCSSHTTMTADMALSDVRAQELYAVYAAAAKGNPSDLTQVPLSFQSFGVAVSPALYAALQTAQGLTNDATAANQPSIKSADYASLVSKNGTVNTVAKLVGDTSLTGELKLARRDDLSGTQAVSNMYFVNGQCGGNDKALVAKSVDQAVAKAGGLLGGLAIRGASDSVSGVLTITENSTSTDVRNVLNSGGYAIGVLGTGSGGAQGTAGHFVKIDGISPNANGANFRNATATRAQIANGAYPFAYTLYGMYVTKTINDAKNTDKKALVLAMMNGFKDSNLSNLSGLAYLDGGVAGQQTAYNRANGNNCSPIVKL